MAREGEGMENKPKLCVFKSDDEAKQFVRDHVEPVPLAVAFKAKDNMSEGIREMIANTSEEITLEEIEDRADIWLYPEYVRWLDEEIEAGRLPPPWSDVVEMSEAGLRGAAAGRKLGRWVSTPHSRNELIDKNGNEHMPYQRIIERPIYITAGADMCKSAGRWSILSLDNDVNCNFDSAAWPPAEIALKRGVQCSKTAQVTLSITGIDMQQRNLVKRFFRWCLAKWRSDTPASYTDQNGKIYKGWRSRHDD